MTDADAPSNAAGERGDAETTTGDWPRGVPAASWWPLLVAGGVAGAYGVAASIVLAIPPAVFGVLLAGSLALLLAGVAGWTVQGLDRDWWTRPSERKLLAAVASFVCVEAATFGAGLAHYAYVRLATGVSLVWVARPARVVVITVALLGSSATVSGAVAAQQRGDPEAASRALGWTIGLGAAFALGLAGEISRRIARSGLAASPAGTAVDSLTALHWLHAVFGLLALAVVRHRTGEEAGTDDGTALPAVSLYWHFVGTVWLALVGAFALGA